MAFYFLTYEMVDHAFIGDRWTRNVIIQGHPVEWQVETQKVLDETSETGNQWVTVLFWQEVDERLARMWEAQDGGKEIKWWAWLLDYTRKCRDGYRDPNGVRP